MYNIHIVNSVFFYIEMHFVKFKESTRESTLKMRTEKEKLNNLEGG